MTNPRLIFVRHGQTDWNRDGIIQGWSDTELNAAGHAQGRALGLLLQKDFPDIARFKHFVSPMRRTRQTMDHILAGLTPASPSAVVEPRLKELGFGRWEGRSFKELRASTVYPVDPVTRFSWRPEGGESYADGLLRLRGFVAELTSPTLVVAHGAIGRCLIGLLANYGIRDLMAQSIPQGAYCLIEAGEARWFDAGAGSA